MWLLIYTVVASNGATNEQLKFFETKEICEQRGISLLEFAATVGLRYSVVCRNADTGETFRVELPKKD